MSEEALKLIEEMKDNCIKQANYVDPKAMEKYNALRNLLEENKELKEKQNCDLKWALKYDELYKENQELKKQLEADYTSVYLKGCEDNKYKYKNQQKEFIEYLENESILHPQYGEYTYYGYRRKIIGEILSKYKEIIGSDINVGSIGGK